jgi:hypothetical protein
MASTPPGKPVWNEKEKSRIGTFSLFGAYIGMVLPNCFLAGGRLLASG